MSEYLIHFESWAGHYTARAEMVRETPKYYVMRLLEAVSGRGPAGTILRRVPKTAVTRRALNPEDAA